MNENAKRKIIVFIDWYLPGFKAGGPVRSMANMVEHLNKYFDFYIVTRNTEYLETLPYTTVNTNTWNKLSNNVSVFYCDKKIEGFNQWRKLILDIKPNLVYINGIYSLKYSLLPLLVARLTGKRPIVVAPRGMLSPSAINVKSLKKRMFLSSAQFINLFKGVTWHVTNSKEAGEVKLLAGINVSIVTAANLARKEVDSFLPINKLVNSLKVCSFARISPEKNTLYAIECLQTVSTNVNIALDIYGQVYDNDYWQKCQAAIELLPKNITVTYKGVVDSALVNSYISGYHVMLLPSRGENFGHVILESLIAGRPVVISDQTPWHNLREQNAGFDLPLNNPLAFAQAFELLAKLPQESYNIWCLGARNVADRFINDEKLIETYKQLFLIQR